MNLSERELTFTLSWTHKDLMLLQCKEDLTFNLYLQPKTLLQCKKLNLIIVVPSGFVTDGATIPKFLWSILSPYEDYFYACYLHDYLCFMLKVSRCFVLQQGWDTHSAYSKRKLVDRILLNVMKQQGIKKLTAYCIYAGVSLYRILCYNPISYKWFKRSLNDIKPYRDSFKENLINPHMRIHAMGQDTITTLGTLLQCSAK